MSQKIVNGKCACEKVKFHATEDVITTFACYCEDCRLASGSSCHLVRITDQFASMSLTIIIQLGLYKPEQVHVDSGSEHCSEFGIPKTTSGNEKYKVFCNQCGTTLWYDCAGRQVRVVVTAVLDAE